jgi:hypothetical protein
MEKFNRAVRRQQIARLKKNRKSYWGYNKARGMTTDVMSPAQLGRIVQYPQACSCPGCGNQRKYEGRKLSELCDFITLKEEVDHVVTFKGAHDE